MLQLNKITKKFGDKTVLNDASLAANIGEIIAIIGQSGAGKSTLLNIIGMLDNEFKGEYSFEKNGKQYLVNELSLKERENFRNNDIGFIFQSYQLIDYLTGFDNIALPLKYGKDKNIKEKVENIMKQLNILELKNQMVKDMSGGEKQRVAIARALIKNPSIIIADEPTGNLDEVNTKIVLDILKNINQDKKKIIIVVTHNNNIIDYFDKVFLIDKGKISNGK